MLRTPGQHVLAGARGSFTEGTDRWWDVAVMSQLNGDSTGRARSVGHKLSCYTMFCLSPLFYLLFRVLFLVLDLLVIKYSSVFHVPTALFP